MTLAFTPEALQDLVRSWPVHPVRVYYERSADKVVVLRIYHQSRSPITR